MIAILLIAGVAVLLVLGRSGGAYVLAHRGDVRVAIAHYGAAGPALFVVAFALLTATGFPPGVLTVVAGFVFGFRAAAATALVAETIGGSATYAAARGWTRSRLVLAPFDLARFERGVQRNAFGSTILMRAVPVLPFFVVSVALGTLRIPFAAFAAGTVLGVIPSTIVFAAAGEALGDAFTRSFSFARPATWPPVTFVAIAGLVALLTVPPLIRRFRARRGRAP